ncbi:WD domain, G-beta repeat, putative [Leishmania donovani]|uniref:WD domain, G-beta repeat, putative n=1 Tax=Leishmania donovani TaxID=5661 RepID=A0A3S7WXC1_LEIDO|nr:WD domain, G-beta repeat, putative [Leishmania donovani]
MHYSTPSTAPPPQQLPSPTEAARARALRAEARLRTVLQQVSALRCAQQEGGGDHVSQHRDPVAGAAEATSELSQASSSPPAHRNAAPTAAAAAASSPPPCPLVLEFPLAPLEQRVKQKKVRDATRQQRRDARQAAAAAAAPTTTASATAANMVRNALSQPLGVVAARFLSAAASGAPSIFPDVAITSTSAADGHMSDWLASTPPPAAAQMSHALPSTATTSGPCPGISPHRAGRGKHTAPPSPASSMHEIPHQSPPPHERGQRCRCGHSPHRHQRLLSSVSASRHSRDSAGDSPSPLALLLRTPPSVSGSQGPPHRHQPSLHHPEQEDRHRHHRRHHHHHHRWCCGAREAVSSAPAPTQSATINAMSKHKQVRPSLRHQGSTPTTKTSHPAGVFGNSSISFLARTLREAGTAALAASPLTRSEMRHTPAAGHRHAGHYRGSRLREKLERSSEGVNVSVAASSPTRTRWPASPGPSHSGSSSHAADGCLPHSSRSSCNFSCVCSRSGCDSWSGSAASWSASSSRTSFARGVRSPPSEPFTPLTILDGRYDPHAPLLPLMGCYGDTPTREVFCRVPSTSTQHTASRSSTPMSSEWSIESSSTAQTAVGAAEAAPVAGFCALNAPGEAVSTAARAQGSEEPVKRQREQQLESQHRRRSMLFSSTANTQLSYMAEMDAIERGVVAPYVSYLFSPEARVIDLRQLKGRARLCDPAPALEATCLGFSRAADEYLVGTSSGLLWRVPTGGGAEAMRATPLGSLWPPYAPTSANPAATAASGTTTGAGDSSGAVGDAPGGGPSKLLPVPLAGHTAAILSIAFNDDGALFATTGMDGCVIVWNASTSAKLRRISAVWASSTSPSSAAASTSMYADVDGAASQRAPHLVHFMPQNNNYLLVSYLGSSELHLYNSSTGLPVTNVAGAALARAAASTVKVHHKSAVESHSRGRAGAGSAASSGAITALAVDPVASPFFFSGDAGGTVVMWTYRAGDVVARATLRTTTAASSPTALAGSGAGKHARTPTYVVDPLLHGTHGTVGSSGDGMAAFSTPLYQLPELRRVTALALPEQLGGIAALGVSTLHISQLHSLFRRCGPRRGAASAQSTSDGGAVGPRPAPRHPFESAAEVFRAVAQQNRACWTAALPGAAAADGVARNQRDSRGRSDAHPQAALHGGPAAFTAVTVTSDDNSSLPQVLARWPSRLSETFSALWRGGDGAPPSAAHSGLAPARHERKLASTAAKGSMATASTAGAAAPATAPSEGDFLHQLRDDALDAVCPLLVLVTLPCDTIYALGVLLQLQPGGRRGSAGGRGGVVAAGTPQVSYCLYPLLKTTSPSRLRHLGVGAVQSPDNPRLIVVATPCEEGFVRVEPLLHVATPSPSVQRTPPAGVSAIPTPGVGSLQPGNKAAAYDDGRHRSHSHVLATLPMPYGGRCTGVAWSPNGRFLVAITAEGVIYQWARVYLLGPSSPSANAAAAAATAAKGNVAPVGGRDGVAPAHGMAPAEGEVEVRSSPAVGAAAAAAARRRGCATERSDTMNGVALPAAHFTGLLGAPMASAAASPPGLAAGENAAARAAFSEEDAWRESLHRELERQRRAQAALKLVAHVRAGGEDGAMSSSGYWLDDDDAANSAVTEDWLEGDETES